MIDAIVFITSFGTDIGSLVAMQFQHIGNTLQMAVALTPPDVSPLPRTTKADGNFIQRALTVVFTIIGAIAVIMIVIGGIKFSGSQGEPQGVAKAKSTIIYAVIGLIVSILAVTIVNFVLGRVA